MYSSLVGLGFLVGLVVAGFVFRLGMVIFDELHRRCIQARFEEWCESLNEDYYLSDEEIAAALDDEGEPYAACPQMVLDAEAGTNTVPLEEEEEINNG